MRILRVLLFVLSLVAVASAADLTIKVVDPQSLPVAGAQAQLLRAGTSGVLATRTTSGDGLAVFHTNAIGPFQVRVLAPGFAVETIGDLEAEITTVQLRLATALETVVVTATRTPLPASEVGASVSTLSSAQLELMQPVAANDALRFLPGAVISTSGQRGGLSSLFVRGGESRYNKVIVDGVAVNEPGGTFDFGTLSLSQGDRMEFVRGTQSTLYGSDAMTSAIQVWTRSGNTRVPELRLGADGGNFSTAHGDAALSGARERFDFNLFGNQFNTHGSGVNDAYSNSLEGANVGAVLSNSVSLRARVRHSNTRTGLPGEWNFNGLDPIVSGNGPSYPLPPNPFDRSQLNNLIGSVELAVASPSNWQHRITGFDYLSRYAEQNPGDPQRISPIFGAIDFPSHEVDDINRAGLEYQGDYSERTWAHTTFGYRLENEVWFVGQVPGKQTPGQRLNHDAYVQQQLTLGRLGIIAGGRFVHSSQYGDTGVPRIALTFQALRGSQIFSGTRLLFSYSTGFKEPRLEEVFAGPPFSIPNHSLKPERVRAFEAGIQQAFFAGKYSLTATYFNNLFHDRIDYTSSFPGQYVNVDKSIAHGAEMVVSGRVTSTIRLDAAYTYTSAQITSAPFCTPANFCDPLLAAGQPLLRRPKHSAITQLAYLGHRWGGNFGASFVGRRTDSDFDGFSITHAAGYVRADLGGWYAIHPRVTAYANIQNALDRRYNEVVGYPALPINFRAGLRFRLGGE